MKIEVNKEARKQRVDEMVEAILNQAKKTAENGLEYFTFYFSSNERYLARNACTEAEVRSENSITVIEKGFGEDSAEFRIKY